MNQYISPALLSGTSTIRCPVGIAKGVQNKVEPHRLVLPCLHMSAYGPNSRIDRGVDEVYRKAARTLTPLTKKAHTVGKAAEAYIHGSLLQVARPLQVPTLMAIAYALQESAPNTAEWNNVRLALNRLDGDLKRTKEQLAEAERIAEGIVNQVFRIIGVAMKAHLPCAIDKLGGTKTIELPHGELLKIDVSVTDENGAIYDLTGCVVTLRVMDEMNALVKEATFTSTTQQQKLGIATVSANLSHITPSSYWYEVWLLDSGENNRIFPASSLVVLDSAR